MSVHISQSVREREKEVRPYILKYSKTFGIDPNLVRALITQESRFVSEAISPTGAYGYGQFTSIGARQIQNIANMSDCPDPKNLHDFHKQEADEKDLGIKAICAYLWWLYNKKYPNVSNRKTQLEAVLTFYNAGGKAAALVIKHDGHEKAVEEINQLPSRYKSQADHYAPGVAAWYVAWHELAKEEEKETPQAKESHAAFVNFLLAYAKEHKDINIMWHTREGITEVSLLFPGELIDNVRD
ncbi:MAG: transglycosylase SLT domain-containing protein [Candidatus Altiarchaeales archaeon]|nr:transglycosylase SLT domain-containing protein [Candidatus Altiarchaeales archaeon]